MHFKELFICVLSLMFLPPLAISQEQFEPCTIAFNFIADEHGIENTINICNNVNQVPCQYEAKINMPVCEDTLCANVVLKIFWDLAGNYKDFDTIPGNPLTKFDHKKFEPADYLKLDKILKSRNSMLRILRKEDLIDKSVKVKSETVDAVTGATPKTVKNSVVEGAVYTSFTLWHFINGPIKNKLANFTQNIYSEQIAEQLLTSENYESQLFALRKLSEKDFENHTDLLFDIIGQSVPLIKAYIIVKAPLPFSDIEKNKQFISLFPVLDNYSKSMFLNRIITEESVAKSLLPLVFPIFDKLNRKQQELIILAFQNFEVDGIHELQEKMEKD